VAQPLGNARVVVFVGANVDSGAVPAADISWVEVVTVPLVPPSTLTVSPSALSLRAMEGGPSSATTLNVAEGSGGSLPWLASASAPWVVLSRDSGSEPGSLAVGALPAGLAPGTYSATVTITSPGALESPRAVNVVLTVSRRGRHPLVYGVCAMGAAGPCGGRRPARR
jgi:hypothetical protein